MALSSATAAAVACSWGRVEVGTAARDVSAKPNKLKTATTVMAAVSRLGDAAGEKDR